MIERHSTAWVGGKLLPRNFHFFQSINRIRTTFSLHMTANLEFDHIGPKGGAVAQTPTQVTISHPPGGTLAAITFRQASGYLPSCRASRPLGRYQVILLGDKSTCEQLAQCCYAAFARTRI